MAEFDLEVDDFIDEMTEVAYVGQVFVQEVDDSLDLTESQKRAGTLRISLLDALTLSQTAQLAGARRVSVAETVTFTESLGRHGVFRLTIDEETIEFEDVASAHNTVKHPKIHETLTLTEHFKYPKKIPTASADFLGFVERVHVGFGIKNIRVSQQLTIGEVVYGHASIHTLRVSESLSLVDHAYRSHYLSVAETVTFTEAYANEVDIFANQTIVFTEALSYQVSKYVHQYLPLYEDVCHKNVFNRTVAEIINLAEYAYHIPDAGEVILSWNGLTDDQWSKMSTGQWNSMILDPTSDNTGIVTFRNTLRLKIKEKLLLAENIDELGGRVHCLVQPAPEAPPQDALNFKQSVGIEIVRAPR
jgi:hypothetical protein